MKLQSFYNYKNQNKNNLSVNFNLNPNFKGDFEDKFVKKQKNNPQNSKNLNFIKRVLQNFFSFDNSSMKGELTNIFDKYNLNSDSGKKISNKNFKNIMDLINDNKLSFEYLDEICSCLATEKEFNEILGNILNAVKIAKVESVIDIRFISYFYSSDYFSKLHSDFEKALPKANLSSLSKVEDFCLSDVLKGVNDDIYNQEELDNLEYYAPFKKDDIETARKIVSFYDEFDYKQNGKSLSSAVFLLDASGNVDKLGAMLKLDKIKEIPLKDLSDFILNISYNSSENFDFDKIVELSGHEKITKDNFLLFSKCFTHGMFDDKTFDYVEKFLNDPEITKEDVEYISTLQLDCANYKKAIILQKAGFEPWNSSELSNLDDNDFDLVLLFAQNNVDFDDVQYFIENYDKTIVEKIASLCCFINSKVLIEILQNNDLDNVLNVLDDEKLEKNDVLLSKLNPLKYNEKICAFLASSLFDLNLDLDLSEISAKELTFLPELLSDIICEDFSNVESAYFVVLDYFADSINRDFKNLNQDDKITLLASLNTAIPYKFDEKYINTVEKVKNLSKKMNTNLAGSFCVYNVKKADSDCFFRDIIANNNKESFEILKSCNIEKYGKNGLPLKFSRVDFLQSLNLIFNKIDIKKRDEIVKKLEITPYLEKKSNKITGYDGIVNYSNLDKNDKIEREIYLICEKFFEKNEVLTDDEKLNHVLNSLIKGFSEFINIIGKKQHYTHEYSLDIHTVKVLKEALCDCEFDKLSNCDKTILKFLILFHDISKQENKISKQHPRLSAIYSNVLLSKFNLSSDVKQRIFKLIENHNWLELLNCEDSDIKTIAAYFSNISDFEIAKIFAKADLKGVGNGFYNEKSSVFNSFEFFQLCDLISQINKSGQIILPNQIINKTKVPRAFFNGKEYMVVDFSKIKDDEDLSNYGFEKGLNKRDLRLNVHMVSDFKQSALTVLNLLKENILCSSLISLSNQSVYCGFKFGAALVNQGYNIANSSKYNQSSGSGKKFKEFEKLLFPVNEEYGHYRTFISSELKNVLKLSDDEYEELFEKICNVKCLSQINKDIKLKNRTLPKNQVISAIKTVQDNLLNFCHNEINSYNPKINAFVARVDSIEEIPLGFLSFVEENNLPILII